MISTSLFQTNISSLTKQEMEKLFSIAKERKYILLLYPLQLIADKNPS